MLGFALSLAVVMASISLVFTLGIGGLEDVQGSQQDRNAEGAFGHLATKFQQLGTHGAPYRAGDLSVAPGALSIRDGGDLTVTVGTGADEHSRTIDLGALAYTREDTRISFEGGGVFRTDGSGTVVLAEPRFDCDDRRALVSVMVLNATGSTSVSADLVTVSARHDATTIWYPTNRTGTDTADSATRVEVDVTSPNAAGWGRFFERTDGWRDPDGDGSYVCETDSVYVRVVEVDLRLV